MYGDDLPRVQRRIARWLGSAMDLVYPPQCVACRAALDAELPSRPFCALCRRQLEALRCPACPRCGVTRAASTPACPTCAGQRFRFGQVARLAPYEGAWREVVLRMKHVANEPLAWGVAGLLAEACQEAFAESPPDVVVPIPMFWRRRIVRRISSADVLATAISRRLAKPCALRGLIRQRHTQPQGDLSPRERRANVRGAFRARTPRELWQRRVLLVDDVLTTGATLNETAKVLRQAGATEIQVAVVARTDDPRA
ncbi:MAG: ComF family protein [Planctomycetaceae bacterium]|nr:ComF family protein [Planctomycetaceae bacterium]